MPRTSNNADVVTTPPCGTRFKAVIHAVAVDGFYQSSPEVVERVVRKSLTAAASVGARTVALTALATGYGRLTMTQFVQAIRPLMDAEFSPIEQVVVCVRNEKDRDELIGALHVAAART